MGRTRTTSGPQYVRRLIAAVTAPAALLVLSPLAVDRAEAVVGTGQGAVQETWLRAGVADEGLTVRQPGGDLLTRGHASVPRWLRSRGWDHIGDPDAAPGFVVDAYQGSARASAKAFLVTYTAGSTLLLVHRLSAGESYHNSFVSVSPDEHWLVAGEWGTVSRLLVFALPRPVASGATATAVRTLPLAGVIALTHPVRNVQGCDFRSSRGLLCSTNDTGTDLFPVPRQLLAVHLAHPLDGGTVRASVRLVDSVPAQDVCVGASGEVEGIDVTDGTVRVAVNSPCASVTEVFTYPRRARWPRAGDIDVRSSWSGAPPLVDVPVPVPTLRTAPRADRACH